MRVSILHDFVGDVVLQTPFSPLVFGGMGVRTAKRGSWF